MKTFKFYPIACAKYTMCINCGEKTYKQYWGCETCGYVGD